MSLLSYFAKDAYRDMILDGQLHIAHSRNDQVCTDFRLWCRDAVNAIVLRIKYLQVFVLIFLFFSCQCYMKFIVECQDVCWVFMYSEYDFVVFLNLDKHIS